MKERSPRSGRTSAGSFERYLEGQLLVAGEGPAWRRLHAQLYRRPVLQRGAIGALRNVSRGQDAERSALLGVVRAELKTSGPASGLLVEGVAQSLAVHLVRTYADVDAPPASSPRRRLTALTLRRIVEQMTRRLDHDLELTSLARHVGLSPAHLSRAFRQTMGETPSGYLLRLRMTAARRLLRETDRSVIEIALSVGYSTHSHFTQVFRRHVGQTPTQYRDSR